MAQWNEFSLRAIHFEDGNAVMTTIGDVSKAAVRTEESFGRAIAGFFVICW